MSPAAPEHRLKITKIHIDWNRQPLSNIRQSILSRLWERQGGGKKGEGGGEREGGAVNTEQESSKIVETDQRNWLHATVVELKISN